METIVFKTLGDLDRLVKFSPRLVQVLRRKMVEARVILRDARSRTCEFNPPYLLLEGHTLWVFEGGKILELHLGPKEWCWRKRGSFLESNIFGYTTKRGYKEINSRQGCQLSFDFELQQSRITLRPKKFIFSKLWHPWLPHKVSTMIWLILANGLLVGTWRTEMGQEGSCQVCNARALETTEHTFSSCETLEGMGKG